MAFKIVGGHGHLLYNTHGGDVYDCVTENLWNQNKIRGPVKIYAQIYGPVKIYAQIYLQAPAE